MVIRGGGLVKVGSQAFDGGARHRAQEVAEFGSRLSEKGLPTPNLFTGGHDFHSPREWASLGEMAAAAATVVRLAEVWTQPELRAAALGAAPLPR